MNDNTLNSIFPISACSRNIEARWTSLQTNVSFLTLKECVRSKSPGPCDCQTYRPDFIVPDANKLWHRDIRAIKSKQVATLETAVALCVAARAMVPKSTATLLASIYAQCRLFDDLAAAEYILIEKRRKDRVKGGKTRQDRLRPAREYALRLFYSMRPPEGWKNVGTAARVIAPHVERFVTRGRLCVFAGNCPIRTIRGWLTA